MISGSTGYSKSTPSSSSMGYNSKNSGSGVGTSKSSTSSASKTKSPTTKNLGFGSQQPKTLAQQYADYHQPPSYTYNPETGGSYTVGDRNNPNTIRNPNTFRNQLSPNGQKLFEAQRQAALNTGATVRPFSGLAGRASGTPNHPAGNAIDVSIAGSNSKYLPSSPQDAERVGQPLGPAFRTYEQFAQATKDQLDKQGYTGPSRWGGYFTTGSDKNDLMHMDVTPGGQTGGGNWKTGATRAQLARLPGSQSQAMTTARDPNQGKRIAAAVPGATPARVAIAPESGLAGRLGQILGITLPPEASRIGVDSQSGPAPLLNDSTFHPPKVASNIRKAVPIGGPVGTINNFSGFPDGGAIAPDVQNNAPPPMLSDPSFHPPAAVAPHKGTGLIGAIHNLLTPAVDPSVSPGTNAPPAPPEYGHGLIGLGNRLRGTPTTDSRHIPGIGDMLQRILTPPTQDPNTNSGTPSSDMMALAPFPGNGHSSPSPSDGFTPSPVPVKPPMTFEQLMAMLSQGNLNGIA